MSFSNYEQRVIINNDELRGVQSVDGSYSINQKPINIAGVGFVDSIVNSPMVGNFSISRKMTGADPLLAKNSLNKYRFDEEDFSGVILYDKGDKGFGFTQGRVSSYSVTCNAGEIPEMQTNITVYGNMGANTVSGGSYEMDANSQYYPFYASGATIKAIVYLGQQLTDKDVTTQWNSGDLMISYEEYAALPNITYGRRRGNISWVILGKDSFYLLSYGESYDSVGSSTLNSRPDIQYPDQASIKITVNDFQIDPISSFSFSRNIQTRPVYALPRGDSRGWYNNTGATHPNLNPIQIDTIYPIQTDINFTMIAEEYEIREIKDRIQEAPISTINIDICDAFDHNIVINSYVGYNVRLLGETINGNINGELSLSMTYKGYETKNR